MNYVKKGVVPAVIIVCLVLVYIFLGDRWGFGERQSSQKSQPNIATFQECVAAGNPVMESYPRQCRAGEETFVEEIGNELEKRDVIMLDSPRPNETVTSPLHISGEARGVWFFEATAPVVVTNWDGLIIGQGYISAEGDWMTESFVPFFGTIEFEKPEYKNNGSLILQKANPSDLSEHDDALEIPIYFE